MQLIIVIGLIVAGLILAIGAWFYFGYREASDPDLKIIAYQQYGDHRVMYTINDGQKPEGFTEVRGSFLAHSDKTAASDMTRFFIYKAPSGQDRHIITDKPIDGVVQFMTFYAYKEKKGKSERPIYFGRIGSGDNLRQMINFTGKLNYDGWTHDFEFYVPK